MLDLYRIDIFLRVVEQGSFSKAAARLSMSQSAVSQHIQSLEHSLGVTLFERSAQGVSLTEEGQTLRGYADRLLRLASEAETSVADVRRQRAGQVVVGATPGASAYLLPDWLQSYHHDYPQITVSVQTATTPVITEAIRARTLALGLIEGELAPEEERRLRVVNLEEVDQLVVVSGEHPWAGRASLPLAALGDQPLIMRQAGSQTRIWLDGLLRQHGVQPAVAAELDNLESIKRMVVRGLGATLLPEYVVRDELAQGLLRAFPIEGHLLRRTLKMVWGRATPLPPPVRLFLRHLSTFVPALRGVL